MTRMDEDPETIGAVRYFMTQAQAALDAADATQAPDAIEALCKEAETWLYMASRCLDPQGARPPKPLAAPLRRPAAEARSFRRED